MWIVEDTSLPFSTLLPQTALLRHPMYGWVSSNTCNVVSWIDGWLAHLQDVACGPQKHRVNVGWICQFIWHDWLVEYDLIYWLIRRYHVIFSCNYVLVGHKITKVEVVLVARGSAESITSLPTITTSKTIVSAMQIGTYWRSSLTCSQGIGSQSHVHYHFFLSSRNMIFFFFSLFPCSFSMCFQTTTTCAQTWDVIVATGFDEGGVCHRGGGFGQGVIPCRSL